VPNSVFSSCGSVLRAFPRARLISSAIRSMRNVPCSVFHTVPSCRRNCSALSSPRSQPIRPATGYKPLEPRTSPAHAEFANELGRAWCCLTSVLPTATSCRTGRGVSKFGWLPRGRDWGFIKPATGVTIPCRSSQDRARSHLYLSFSATIAPSRRDWNSPCDLAACHGHEETVGQIGGLTT